MMITTVKALSGHKLEITTSAGITAIFDVSPYLEYDAFLPLKDEDAFRKISNGGYFVEWDCGADLSADTIEAGMRASNSITRSSMYE
ncbi:MAG: DUF2442 domain-containing protein [Chitinivibrionales bacterium]|nr:DUF2442 domain-containing protein [Chitinivibrionales bacterium]